MSGPAGTAAGRFGRWSEAGRLLLLAAAGVWLLHPFATGRQIGAGDALWYANMLADFVLQLRAGVFPIFVGQTIHAFNGAVYPLRVAPLYQHLAGILDLLTLHRLGFFALQHLLVIVCGAAGLFGCYFALVAVAPARRWSATLLAILYLSCPGILAVIYTQDLYMTWTAVPFLPLAAYGIVRTFQRDDWASQYWLAAPLAALWWAHSPVAMWMTGFAALTQLARLAAGGRNGGTARGPLARAAGGGLIFAALAQYPIFSFTTLRPAPAPAAVAYTPPPLDLIPVNVRAAWPRAVLPLSPRAGSLGDVQLGYGLALMAALAAARRRRPTLPWISGLLLLGVAGFALLLVPVPRLNPWLWSRLPLEIRAITFYWLMQRFYPIMAALVVFAAQLAGDNSPPSALPTTTESHSPRRVLSAVCFALLAASAGWSLWESREFIRAGRSRTGTEAAAETALRPENLLLMDHSYGLFAALPGYFSDGVMDPQAETRLLDPATFRPLPPLPNEPKPRVRWKTSTDANPGILDLAPSLHLLPGRRYELAFAFDDPERPGVLELSGRTFFRQYLLPSSGQPLSFGSGPGHSHSLPLGTTDPAGEDISLRFIPTGPHDSPKNHPAFGRYRLRELDALSRPVRLVSLLPFRAEVEAAGPALLETPRMAQPGYAAWVDGRPAPVRNSPQGLVAVPVPSGRHEVELRFIAPAQLRISYAAAGAAWALLLAAGAAGLIRGWQRPSHP